MIQFFCRTCLAITLLTIISCSYTERIKDGQTAYERKQYAVAIDFFSKEFAKESDASAKAKKAFLIAKSYQKINDNAQAADWFKKAQDNGYGSKATIKYAYALKSLEQYELAAQAFRSAASETGAQQYQKEAENCNLSAEWIKQIPENDYTVEQLSINSPAADYAPFLAEENELVFTSDRVDSEGKETYKWTGIDYSDLYKADLKSNTVSAYSDKLNSPYNDGAASFNKSKSTIYFTRCGTPKKEGIDYCKIVFSKKMADGSWTAPKIMSFVDGSYNFAHPYFDENSQRLYFSSDRPGGMGASDLYYVQKIDNSWGEPVSLGRFVNTEQDEKFPFVHKDTLYFASNGLKGMGGLDLFYAATTDSYFKNPVNLKAPMNSGGDDFALIIDEANSNGLSTKGYFSSTRKDGVGLDDIYKFTSVKKTPPPPPPPPKDTTPIVIQPPIDTPPVLPPPPPTIVYENILTGKVFEKTYNQPDDPNSGFAGNRPLPNATITLNYNGSSITLTTDNEGNFSTTVQESTTYRAVASKTGYFTQSKSLTTDARNPDRPIRNYTMEFVLDKIYKDKEIVLENIYYDYDKWNIRADAEPPLNKLVRVLQENPEIRIQLSSHTDCRGDLDYNQTLSQKRAQSAVDYIISRGIDPTRLTAKGYGESSPAMSCACNSCSEEEHQANRRTTFKVI